MCPKYNRKFSPPIFELQRSFETKLSQACGQALVEFTLVFILFLIVAWVPADFGLAFFTGQVAQNAAREGVRIAAADTTLLSQLGGNISIECTLPCSGAGTGSILRVTADRLSPALLPGAMVRVQYPFTGVGTCNQIVRVSVTGAYSYYYYKIFRLIGITVPDSTQISRIADARWEHQSGC
jgi:hypothetical protein